MKWSEAKAIAKAGLHVRLESWPAGHWLIYQRNLAWYWDGTAWRVVEAGDFGLAEWEADNWTHIPPALKDCEEGDTVDDARCCKPLSLGSLTIPVGTLVASYTGLGNIKGEDTVVRLLSDTPEIIWLRMDMEEYAGVWDGDWRMLNPAGEPIDHLFALAAGGHFSLRMLRPRTQIAVVWACFGEAIAIDPACPPQPSLTGGMITPPHPMPKVVCEEYRYAFLDGGGSLDNAPAGNHGEQVVMNPFPVPCDVLITDGTPTPGWPVNGATWVGVDDELTINGARVEGGNRPAHSGVHHPFVLPPSGSFTLGVANTTGFTWYNLRVCMTPIYGSPAP